ncbi:serine--tRNA ligase, partial [Candidatus Woesebacteria bacterium]|nr:serine--tRNA ligase [Candidatus Woesebacteria bacterium]
EGKKIKEELKGKEPELAKVENQYKEFLLQIPNLPADDVKEGKDENENEVVRSWGEPKKFDFEAKDHIALGESLNIIDIERAAKVSGPRFAYLKGDAMLLEFALVQLALETLMKEGFVPVIPPVLIKKEMMEGMGYLEHGGEEDMYVFDKDGLVLVGTSEQTIGPMHANEVLRDLPLRYVGFSSCFRRESGSYGKDTRGILRVHQFDKVEMFSFTKPEDSDKEHEYLLSLEEKLFQALEIPYQVVKMCTGDLGAPAARKYDLEAWMPGQGTYREVTSTSTTTDFQARRLNIKYQDGGKTELVHILNGTAFAIGRTIIAILENYQQKDGSVIIPEALRKWVGKDRISKTK